MATLSEQLTGMEQRRSPFEQAIRSLPLPVCPVFGSADALRPVRFEPDGNSLATRDSRRVSDHYPRCVGQSANRVMRCAGELGGSDSGLRVAAFFSGGPAAGGHNVLVGLKHMLGAGNTLLGVQGGPRGLLGGKLFEITDADVAQIINTGGFDFLGTDRTKIRNIDQIEKVRAVCQQHRVDALVVIGGDDSNTNAALLAEALYSDVHADGRGVRVIGVPKTIDGDLQHGDLLPISFGFDTATRIYAELTGNILSDTLSSRKYWHFVKLMGRAASHVTLEVALQTRPAVALISEEVAHEKMSLDDIVTRIAQIVVSRSQRGMHYGVLLVPEGLIEFVPEMHALIEELNDVMAQSATDLPGMTTEDKRACIYSKLSAANSALLTSLPDYIQAELLAERDAHGNLQLSLIPTEQLLVEMVGRKIREIDPKTPFATQHHFFGYEGRCGAPTLFDAAFCYNLGLTAASLILGGHTGYMASVNALTKGGEPLALPLTGMLTIERRQGHDAFVIEKTLVDIDGPAMQYFRARRDDWAEHDRFASPGPRQLWGPTARLMPMTVALNSRDSSLDFHFGN